MSSVKPVLLSVTCVFSLESPKNTINMKILTHNMLTSNIIKSVKDGYPLKIAVSSSLIILTVSLNL